jgi:hypothetical protein
VHIKAKGYVAGFSKRHRQGQAYIAKPNDRHSQIVMLYSLIKTFRHDELSVGISTNPLLDQPNG